MTPGSRRAVVTTRHASRPGLLPRRLTSLVLAGWLLGPILPAAAQSGAPADTAKPAVDLGEKKQQLNDLDANAASAEAQRKQAEADLESIRTDRVRLTAALIDTTNRVRAAENQVAAIEKRLDLLTGSQDAIKESLVSRRALIGEVLAALQRMGRKPLPAMLVSPDDMLLAIRTSMLLGAVVPELRSATEALASDLAELTRLRGAVAQERDTLAQQIAALGSERERLAALIAARQTAEVAAEGSLDQERQHAADLARQATNLKDLVSRLEGEVASARRAADAARAADDARQKAAEADADAVRAKVAAGATRDPARLAPAMAFAEEKGRLLLPVAGTVIRNFGSNDSYGGQERGMSIATRARSVVSSPADGWISFSGPYRSYGQLLIINGGEGYYIVLAGLDGISVAPGQFVLAGEPVGSMGMVPSRRPPRSPLAQRNPFFMLNSEKTGRRSTRAHGG